MDPLHVALDIGPLHGHRTGVGAAVAELRVALEARSDVQVHPYVLSFRTRPSPPTRRLPLPAALAHRLWAHIDRPRVDRWLRPADVVHGTNYVVPPSALPRLVSVYDCWFLTHPSQATPAVRRASVVLRRAVAAGAAVHTSSTATGELVRQLLGTDRVEVVPLGPLPVPAAPSSPPSGWLDALDGRRYVLAVGTIERRKNLPALATAFAAAGTDADLVIAGAPADDSDALDNAIAGLPPAVHARVHLPGAVDESTKGWLLAHAGAVAYPSLDEGFGFPLLEAQTAGVPVVATRAGSIPEVAGEGAELVPPGDTDALAAGLARVVGDDERRAALVAAGRRNVERFSWPATAEALVAVYRRLRDGGS